jgi:hypothetical protein
MKFQFTLKTAHCMELMGNTRRELWNVLRKIQSKTLLDNAFDRIKITFFLVLDK